MMLHQQSCGIHCSQEFADCLEQKQSSEGNLLTIDYACCASVSHAACPLDCGDEQAMVGAFQVRRHHSVPPKAGSQGLNHHARYYEAGQLHALV